MNRFGFKLELAKIDNLFLIKLLIRNYDRIILFS
jgi:hypothetical protein